MQKWEEDEVKSKAYRVDVLLDDATDDVNADDTHAIWQREVDANYDVMNPSNRAIKQLEVLRTWRGLSKRWRVSLSTNTRREIVVNCSIWH